MKTAVPKLKLLSAIALALAFTAGIFASAMVGTASSNAQPADKMAVAGKAISISGAGEIVTLLEGSMKTSSPTDAVITLNLECSLLTKVVTVGNDESEAMAQLQVWVEVDGTPVAVSADDTGDDAGKVVFCNRLVRQTTTLFDDEDATIESFQSTRSTHSFQWITLNMGSAEHHITVKGVLTEEATSNAVAQAVVGKRTLTVEPTKLANNAVI